MQNTTVHTTGMHTNWYIFRLIVYAMHTGITTKMCNIFLKAACETFSINTVRINYKLFENMSSKIHDFQRMQNKGIIFIWRRNLVINSTPPPPPQIKYLISVMKIQEKHDQKLNKLYSTNSKEYWKRLN